MSELNKHNSIKNNETQIEKKLKQNKKNMITNHKPDSLSKRNVPLPISNLQNKTEKMKFLYNFISNDNHMKSINEIITEEANNVDDPKYINNIQNINLLEKDIDSLYKWDNLFNNFKPLNCYTTILKNNEPQIEKNLKQNKKNMITSRKPDSLSKRNAPLPISNLQNKSEKMKFLYNFISNDTHMKSIKEIITEEANNVDDPKYINNIQNINLLEKDIDSLYKWDNLFNNFKPLNCYTTILKNNETIPEEENEDIVFKNPTILVDLTRNQMNLYFGRNNSSEDTISKKRSQSSKKSTKFKSDKSINNSNNIRPKSLYETREANSAFYFSSTFNDYYKEDLKTFSNKMPILKPKLYFKQNKIKREIKGHLARINKKEKILNNLKNLHNILLKKQDLVIAARRNNPLPLLKSIFKQNFPGFEFQDEPKMYYKTMKPYGNSSGFIDYSKNERWRFCEEMAKLRNPKSKRSASTNTENSKFLNNYTNNNSESNINNIFQNNNKLILSYYDIRDPYINIFNKKIGNITKKNLSININGEINSCKKNIENRGINTEIESNFKADKGINIKLIKEESYKNIDSVPKNKEIYSMQPIINQQQKKYSNENINNTNKPKTKTFKKELTYDYRASICFPVKKSSNVGNISYNKINQLLKERQLNYLNKKDYFLAQSSTIRNINDKNVSKEDKASGNTSTKKPNIEFKNEVKVKIKPKRNFSLYREALNEDKRFKTVYHWDKQGNLINKPKVKYFCFNDYVDTVFLESHNNCNTRKSIDVNNKLEKKINDIESAISTDKNLDKDKITLS